MAGESGRLQLQRLEIGARIAFIALQLGQTAHGGAGHGHEHVFRVFGEHHDAIVIGHDAAGNAHQMLQAGLVDLDADGTNHLAAVAHRHGKEETGHLGGTTHRELASGHAGNRGLEMLTVAVVETNRAGRAVPVAGGHGNPGRIHDVDQVKAEAGDDALEEGVRLIHILRLVHRVQGMPLLCQPGGNALDAAEGGFQIAFRIGQLACDLHGLALDGGFDAAVFQIAGGQPDDGSNGRRTEECQAAGEYQRVSFKRPANALAQACAHA